MSPFDYAGPQFLVFYLALGTLVLLALFAMRHLGESDDPPPVNFTDPYLIAYLRGGRHEAIRLATLSLIDRGFLKVEGDVVMGMPDRPPSALRVPVERSTAEFFAARATAPSAFQNVDCIRATAPYEDELLRLRLLPDNAVRSARLLRFAVAAAVLLGVAGYKLVLAAERGRHNVGFLIILAIAFPIAAYPVSRSRLTRRGRALVRNLQTLFAPLAGRSASLRPGANPNEMMLLAAVFGVAAVPVSLSAYARTLYPKAAAGGSGCGAACGSSSCGSSGSSCGGGGCGGGGCGGCGGG